MQWSLYELLGKMLKYKLSCSDSDTSGLVSITMSFVKLFFPQGNEEGFWEDLIIDFSAFLNTNQPIKIEYKTSVLWVLCKGGFGWSPGEVIYIQFGLYFLFSCSFLVLFYVKGKCHYLSYIINKQCCEFIVKEFHLLVWLFDMAVCFYTKQKL